MIILVTLMLVLLVMGIPIGYALGLSSLFYVVLFTDISPLIVAQQVCVGADSLILLALPFFLLAGELMNVSGITDRLTRFSLSLIGPVRGGLSWVVILVNMLVAMVSGAAIASAAAVGSTMVPMMKKEGYPAGFAAALNASAATIGPIIPPSVGFIIYASVSGASVGKLFLAGVVPGLLIGAGLIAVCQVIALRKLHPKPAKHSWKEVTTSFKSAIPALLMPLIVLGGIFGGLVTPTEAGALAVGYGLVAGLLIYRTLSIRQLPGILYTTAKRTASIMIIIAGASCFGFLVSRELDSAATVQMFQSITDRPALLLLIIVIVILILGTFMEGGSIMIILTPHLMPVLAAYAIDPVHFGVVFQGAIMIGLLTPPLGMLLFVLSGVSDVPVKSIVRNLWPFYLLLTAIVLLIAFVPSLTIGPVELIGGALK